MQFSGPEPTVDFVRKEIRSVAAFEVTEATRSPDVLYLRKLN